MCHQSDRVRLTIFVQSGRKRFGHHSSHCTTAQIVGIAGGGHRRVWTLALLELQQMHSNIIHRNTPRPNQNPEHSDTLLPGGSRPHINLYPCVWGFWSAHNRAAERRATFTDLSAGDRREVAHCRHLRICLIAVTQAEELSKTLLLQGQSPSIGALELNSIDARASSCFLSRVQLARTSLAWLELCPQSLSSPHVQQNQHF